MMDVDHEIPAAALTALVDVLGTANVSTDISDRLANARGVWPVELKSMRRVITGAGAVSGERSSGTAVLTLTKPVSRGAFVLAKIVSQAGLLIAATVVSTAVCAVLTVVIFGPSPLGPLVMSVSIWTIDALLMIVVMTLFSAGFAARGASAR